MVDFLNTIGEVLSVLLRARPGRRREIRADVELLHALSDAPGLGPNSPAAALLRERISIQTALLAGVQLPGTRQPRKWSSIFWSLLLGCGLGYWSYKLSEHGFDFWSLLPGIPGGLFLVAALGMLISPDRVPDPEATTDHS